LRDYVGFRLELGPTLVVLALGISEPKWFHVRVKPNLGLLEILQIVLGLFKGMAMTYKYYL